MNKQTLEEFITGIFKIANAERDEGIEEVKELNVSISTLNLQIVKSEEAKYLFHISYKKGKIRLEKQFTIQNRNEELFDDFITNKFLLALHLLANQYGVNSHFIKNINMINDISDELI
jgi:hypothetical protein